MLQLSSGTITRVSISKESTLTVKSDEDFFNIDIPQKTIKGLVNELGKKCTEQLVGIKVNMDIDGHILYVPSAKKNGRKGIRCFIMKI